MKKIIIFVFLVYADVLVSAEHKDFEKSVTPWILTAKTTYDTCPEYQTYTKKVITASSRGEINNTGWILKDEFRSCDPVDIKERRISYDISYLRQGDPDEEMITTEVFAVIGRKECDTCGWPQCIASKKTHEVKVTFPGIKQVIDVTKDAVKKFPRVNNVTVQFNPVIKVKTGEDCCSKNKPPVSYMELKGGVEASLEIEFILWGFSAINVDFKLWPFLIVMDIQPPAFTLTPSGKITIEGVGKQYSKPECKTCFYLSGKLEYSAKLAVKAGAKLVIFRWKAGTGYDLSDESNKIEASAEASVSVLSTGQVTAASKDCVKPQPGIHGSVSLDGVKANLKFKVSLGIISFNYDYELKIWDGFGPLSF